MAERRTVTTGTQAPARYQDFVARAQAWLCDWAEARADEGPSSLVSLLLHLAVLILLCLCPIAFSGDNHADTIGAVVTRLDAGDDSGALDGLVALDAVARADANRGHVDEAQARQIDPRVERPALDFLAAGADDVADGGQNDDASSQLAMKNVSPPDIKFDRDQDAKAAPPGAKGGGKTSRTTQRTAGNGKEHPINVEGLLDGRSPAARAKLAKSAGGTKESERAVDLGLDWLVRHQKADGSWSFQHGPDDPGTVDCPMGATGLALLAFLGAGHTHQRGLYRSQVNLGLKYLVDHMEENNLGGWLQGTGQATMYVQGIGTIALCEACSMTKDPTLRRPAQLAIDFIVRAQDPEGGGWRYRIPQAGDTSVVGWQLMALQSARIAN